MLTVFTCLSLNQSSDLRYVYVYKNISNQEYNQEYIEYKNTRITFLWHVSVNTVDELQSTGEFEGTSFSEIENSNL